MPDTDLAATIASSVRRLRHERTLTLDALAVRSALSKGTLCQVEQGRANPSIATLTRLADALGVGVATLIEPQDRSPRVTVRRKDQAASLWSSEAGSRATFHIGTDPPDIIELWDWRLEPGDGFDGEAHAPGTVEVLHVRTGRLRLTIGERTEALRPGDAVLFEAHAPHRYANEGRSATTFTMLVLQPADRPLGDPDTIAEGVAG